MVRLTPDDQEAFEGLSSRQRVAYAGHNAIPFTFLGCGVINQYAVYVATSKITAVVPNVLFAKAGHHKKAGRNPLIYDVGGRVLTS